VVQDFFDTNEAMMARLRAGGGRQFDLVVASDYAVEMMAAAGELEPLDPELLPNRRHLHPRFQGLPYDPDGRWSVPYQWGTTGIGVRTDRVEGDPARLATWGVFFDPDAPPYRFALLDDPRETIGAALLYLGHSVNSTDESELAAAEALVARARDRAVAFTPATTGRDLLVAGEVDLAHNHSGDVAVAREERGDVVYLLPREGAVIWADNMVIPAGSAGSYTAHVFMNFLLDPENGARLTNEIRYLSPNEGAWPHLDPELREEATRSWTRGRGGRTAWSSSGTWARSGGSSTDSGPGSGPGAAGADVLRRPRGPHPVPSPAPFRRARVPRPPGSPRPRGGGKLAPPAPR
jgi:spermidine/putrescine transport system substrate-binding protein